VLLESELEAEEVGVPFSQADSDSDSSVTEVGPLSAA
jgi:hypothetical protein